MKRIFSISALVLCAATLAACSNGQKVQGNGKVTTQERNLPSYSNIDVKGKFHVMVERRWPQKTSVTVDSNLQQYVLTVVKNGTLDIMPKQGYNLQPSTPITVKLATRDVKEINTEGDCTLDATGLNANNFKFDSKGDCRATLVGRVDKAGIHVKGAARIDAKNLISKDLALDIKGAAEAYVYATKKLDVKITGTGQVTYYGNPPVVNQAIFGGGQLKAAKKKS